MKKSFLDSPNFWAQVATVILSIFAIGGANIDAVATGDSLVGAVFSNSLWAIGSIVIIQIVNPLYHWIRTPIENRWTFLHSLNWWTNFGTLITSIGVFYGIYTDSIYNFVPELVQSIADRNYNNLIMIALANFVLPLIKIFVKRPTVVLPV